MRGRANRLDGDVEDIVLVEEVEVAVLDNNDTGA